MAEVETYFNSRCPVCGPEIDRCRRVAERSGQVLVWRDINLDPEALARFGVTRDDVVKRLHVIDREGRLHVGVAAFAVLWDELPGHRWLARLLRWPVVRAIASLGYEVFAWPLFAYNKLRDRRSAHQSR
jgi:predicted DCC family thiol-disulfide oxidoreductase YuxK